MSGSNKVIFLNRSPMAAFVGLFGNVVEHSPALAAAVWSLRPFRSLEDLEDAFLRVLDSLSKEVRAGVLRVHPDLGGRLELTAESLGEQRGAGLEGLSGEERVSLRADNEEYVRRFGFPFVLCVRENKKEGIIRSIAARLHNAEDVELATGFEEVKKIALFRIRDVAAANPALFPIQ